MFPPSPVLLSYVRLSIIWHCLFDFHPDLYSWELEHTCGDLCALRSRQQAFSIGSGGDSARAITTQRIALMPAVRVMKALSLGQQLHTGLYARALAHFHRIRLDSFILQACK